MASVFRRKSGRWFLRVRQVHGGGWDKIPSDARTKAEAERMAMELELKRERQRLGLEALPSADGGGTVAALLEWWLEGDAKDGTGGYSKASPSHSRNAAVIRKHLLKSEMASHRLADLRSAHVEAFLHAKCATLAPDSVNKLRTFLLSAFNRAREVGRYEGNNPVASVKPRKVPEAAHDYLRVEEVSPVLAAVPREWRALFACALYTGLRRGELYALRKRDVDLKRRLLTVARSHDRDTTKGAHADAIPIAAELVPFLEHAIAASPSGLVFPRPDGSQWAEKAVNLCRILRQAMITAEVVEGYEHRCRRRGCKHREHAADKAQRFCPKCRMQLWPVAKVRPLRFHDLRHTTGSLLTQAGVPPAAVQRILRHSDVRITIGVYSHLSPAWLQNEIDRLQLGTAALVPPTPLRAVANAPGTSLVPLVSPSSTDQGQAAGPPAGNRAQRRENLWRPHGDLNPSRRRESQVGQSTEARSASQSLEKTTVTTPGTVHALQPFAPDLRNFVPAVSPSRLAVLEGGYRNLLTVRQVAERLGVCAATVYSLVNGGRLPHVRVSNAIRVSPEDLAAYVEAQRRGGK
jgi:integrase